MFRAVQEAAARTAGGPSWRSDPRTVARTGSPWGTGIAALYSLEAAYEERSGWMAFRAAEPELAPLAAHPRFRDLLRRGLPLQPAS